MCTTENNVVFLVVAFYMIHMNKNAVPTRNAKSLVQIYDEQSAALQIAQQIVSPEYGDLKIGDERWGGVKALLKRVRELAEEDLDIQTVIDDIADYLIGQFRDLDSLSQSVEAERAMSTGTEACSDRLIKLEAVHQTASERIDRLSTILRDVHVEMTMRETGDGAHISEDLRSLFHRLQADNEVSDAISEEASRLPREEIEDSASQLSNAGVKQGT